LPEKDSVLLAGIDLKPLGIKYGVEDRPPLWQAVLLILQHVLTVSGALVIPALIAREGGSTAGEASHLITVSLLVMGIGTLLQANRRLGSGYLCTAVCGAEFVPASILAIKTGGLPLLSGMLIITALFQALLVPIVTRLRSLFPVEVTGVVVFMTGLSLVRYSMGGFLGTVGGQVFVNGGAMGVSVLTLAILVTACVWGRGVVRQYALLIGIAGGVLLAHFLMPAPISSDGIMGKLPVFAIPFPGQRSLAWNPALLGLFLIAGFCSMLGTLGNVTACQKINTVDWRRPDMPRLGRGVLAEALGNLAGGFFGSVGLGSSASSAGLSLATGVTSRCIGTGVGLGYIGLAFFPGLISRFALLPGPVLDACLVFSISFIMLAGFQILMSRMIDARKTFVIGFSIVAGLFVEMNPAIRGSASAALQPLLGSALSISAIVALTLNLLFRLGVKKTAELRLGEESDHYPVINRFIEEQGAAWGVRKDVIDRAGFAILQYVEALSGMRTRPDAIGVKAHFDEFHLDIEIAYPGKQVDLPVVMPSPDEMLADDAGVTKMAGYLVRRHADRVSTDQSGDTVRVRLSFDH